ncbi:MAG: 16S rRNA (adenine(1518)-N(6)/adenine(1519)-N(6))-dimethyltransferase RsmA [Trueperaceae bacterium]|nr:16S rRNA (adenine(1518)-N(6)/adenine(1519)-N(6))-dimethyltransferase RsmA [Trueperaceae bacterium]
MKRPNLSARATVKDLLERYALRADKAFGQNFLVDEAILGKIVNAAELTPQDKVIEVGPGLGVLTRALAQTGAEVSALELDERLLPVLAETVGHLENVSIIHRDALTFDYSALPTASVMVANLPYNVATPVIMRALESGRFKRLVFLVQKEVAERFTAQPGSKAYGALSVIIRYFAQAQRIYDVKPGSFMPAPEVTSSIVELSVNKNLTYDQKFIDFVHETFRYRRKTLKKNLQMMGYLLTDVQSALSQLKYDDKIRAEALELDDFKNLFHLLA